MPAEPAIRPAGPAQPDNPTPPHQPKTGDSSDRTHPARRLGELAPAVRCRHPAAATRPGELCPVLAISALYEGDRFDSGLGNVDDLLLDFAASRTQGAARAAEPCGGAPAQSGRGATAEPYRARPVGAAGQDRAAECRAAEAPGAAGTGDGRRPVAQLDGVLPRRYQRLLLAAPGAGPRRLRSLHLSRTTAEVIDVCGRVEQAERSRALTGRMVHEQGNWVLTQLQFV